MAVKNKKRKFLTKIRNKYRLVLMNDSTFEEIFTFKLSRLNVFTLASIIVLVLLSLGIVSIALTPLREFIPYYPDGNMRKNIINNALMVDSLKNELQIRDQYFSNLKNIINGNETNRHELINDTDIVYHENTDSIKEEDSDFKSEFEADPFNFVYPEYNSNINDISTIVFFPPLHGLITNGFDAKNKHYGVDIVSAEGKYVLATLDGTIIFSGWTLETGNIIQIQHKNELISVYKHNSLNFKEEGDYVKAGEPIAIIGNTGELSTGPHLHFELWHRGTPVDPEKYISFK